MKDASKILDKKQLQQKVNRLAWQVYERNYTQKEIVIVGIEKRGVELSKRLASICSILFSIPNILNSLTL